MGYRVVIGDDESIIRMDLCEMLEDAGHTVVGEAADGVEALDLVRKEKPDIVLLDIKMPRLDGIHAARMIGHEGPILRRTVVPFTIYGVVVGIVAFILLAGA